MIISNGRRETELEKLNEIWSKGGGICTNCTLPYNYCYECGSSGVYEATTSRTQKTFSEEMSFQKKKIDEFLEGHKVEA